MSARMAPPAARGPDEAKRFVPSETLPHWPPRCPDDVTRFGQSPGIACRDRRLRVIEQRRLLRTLRRGRDQIARAQIDAERNDHPARSSPRSSREDAARPLRSLGRDRIRVSLDGKNMPPSGHGSMRIDSSAARSESAHASSERTRSTSMVLGSPASSQSSSLVPFSVGHQRKRG